MTKPIQLTAPDGSVTHVVLTVEQYQELTDLASLGRQSLQSTRDDLRRWPAQVVAGMTDGASPVQAWREYRGMTQTDLAKAADINRNTVIKAENDPTSVRASILARIAEALNVADHGLTAQDIRGD